MQVWAALDRTRDISATLRPSPEKTTCSFPWQFSGKTRNSGLVPGNRIPTVNTKTHKHFSDGPCGTIVPGTNPHPSQGQTGQNGDFSVELNRERPVCPRDGSHFVPGRGPICPRDGSCLSRTPSRRKCLHRPAENAYVYSTLLVFSCPIFGPEE